MSKSISLQVATPALFHNLKHAFSAGAVVGELLQNARRAGATRVDLVYDDASKTLSVQDNGSGVTDLQSLFTAAESGWSEDVKTEEIPFGLGFFSVLYACERINIRTSCQDGDSLVGAGLTCRTEDLLAGAAIDVVPVEAAEQRGTRITLEGFNGGLHLHSAYAAVQGFPIEVSLNGELLERKDALDCPPADADMSSWCDTAIGKVRLRLTGHPRNATAYVQGLRVSVPDMYAFSNDSVVHLDATFQAKLPDRVYLVNPRESGDRIIVEMLALARRLLEARKATMSPEDFVRDCAEMCDRWGCPDLLNDMDVVPVGWFVDWEKQPEGYTSDSGDCYCRTGYTKAEQLVSRATLQKEGVFHLPDDDDAEYVNLPFAARCWLSAGNRWTLGRNPPTGHWLRDMVVQLTDDAFRMDPVDVVGSERVGTYDGNVDELVVCESITVTRKSTGESVNCRAARDGSSLYVTGASGVTTRAVRLCGSYMDDHRWNEDAQDDDETELGEAARRIAATSPADLLKTFLSSIPASSRVRLASASIRLTFAEDGTLKEAIAA